MHWYCSCWSMGTCPLCLEDLCWLSRDRWYPQALLLWLNNSICRTTLSMVDLAMEFWLLGCPAFSRIPWLWFGGDDRYSSEGTFFYLSVAFGDISLIHTTPSSLLGSLAALECLHSKCKDFPINLRNFRADTTKTRVYNYCWSIFRSPTWCSASCLGSLLICWSGRRKYHIWIHHPGPGLELDLRRLCYHFRCLDSGPLLLMPRDSVSPRRSSQYGSWHRR